MNKVFDTLEYVENAKKSGFTDDQARFQAHEFSRWFNNDLVTKSFLKNEFVKLEQRLTIKLGGIMLGGIGLLGFILKH